ncbi:MAG: tyrosine-type recombinase/integrase [Flavobacteriales bacterium]|nr:tyrosine-type recombinase/integrase [Flavobacteriales bacterium]
MEKSGIKTIEECFEEYITECKYARGLRPATLKGYIECFRNFVSLMPELKETNDLCPNSLTVFYQRLNLRQRRGKVGVKNSTLHTYYTKLMIFFRWLEERSYLVNGFLTNKILKPTAPTYEDEKALTPEEVSAILSSIFLLNIDNDFLFARDMLIIQILLYTGIRKGELLGLRVSDIDLSSNSILINGKTSKSKRGRFIPMHPNLVQYLKSYLLICSELKFLNQYLLISRRGTTLTEYGLKHWVERYRKASGIPLHIHRFRHTFACELAKKNADIISIRNVLGHSSLKMTERYLRSIKPESSRTFINSLTF